MSQQPSYGPPAYGSPPGGGSNAPPAKATAPGLVTASMGRRLGARLLDGLVLGVPLALVIGALGAWAALGADSNDEPPAAPLIILGLLIYVILPLAVIAYEIILTASGGTLGKRWLGLRVVLRETGAVPGGGPAALRWLIPFACSFVPLLGTMLVYLSPFFDSSGLRQGWHDMVAGTRVIDVNSKPHPS